MLALGGVAAWWYLHKKQTATVPVTTTTPALLPTSSPLPAPAITNANIPSTSSSAIIPSLPFNAPPAAPPNTPTIAITAATSPIPAASTGPTVSQMDTLQAWAQGALTPCDLSRWNQYKPSFTSDEWNSLIDIYFNDWIGGQGNTPQRLQEWDDWRTKYQILTNTPC